MCNTRPDGGAIVPDDVISHVRQRPIAVDLYTGVGGLALGLEQAGYWVALAAENDERTARYAQYNLPLTNVLTGAMGDVRRLRATAIRAALPSDREVTLLTGGPPCQGFSLAGRLRPDDPLVQLVDEFARLVNEIKPRMFLMENVPGLMSMRPDILKRFERKLRLNYRVQDPVRLVASDFGVPQNRERVFVLGVRRDVPVEPSLPAGDDVAAPPVKDVMADLPSPDPAAEYLAWHGLPYREGPRSEYALRMMGATRDVEDKSVRRIWGAEICSNVGPTIHGPAVLARFEKLKHGEVDQVSGLIRLHPDRIAPTVRAGTERSRGSRSAPRPVHAAEPRVLTTRELARLQSFPDWFYFHPVKWHGNRQVGNAVPPLMARVLGRSLLQAADAEVDTVPLEDIRRDISLVAGDYGYPWKRPAQEAERGE